MFSINGYSLQELSIVFTLTQWGELSSENSIVVAILNRLMFIVASVPGAVVFLSVMARSGSK